MMDGAYVCVTENELLIDYAEMGRERRYLAH